MRLFFIFSVFSIKQYNFYKKLMWKSHVHPVYSTGIQTHDLSNMTTRPGFPPNSNYA